MGGSSCSDRRDYGQRNHQSENSKLKGIVARGFLPSLSLLTFVLCVVVIERGRKMRRCKNLAQVVDCSAGSPSTFE